MRKRSRSPTHQPALSILVITFGHTCTHNDAELYVHIKRLPMTSYTMDETQCTSHLNVQRDISTSTCTDKAPVVAPKSTYQLSARTHMPKLARSTGFWCGSPAARFSFSTRGAHLPRCSCTATSQGMVRVNSDARGSVKQNMTMLPCFFSGDNPLRIY